MITTITPLRRVAVTLVLTGATAFGAVAVAPAPAPVVTPPLVVIGKDGKPVKQPKVCTDKDNREYAEKLAKANQQAAPLLKAAAQLREAANALRAQVAKLTPAQARIVQALAGVGDLAASKLEAQAQALITKVGGIGCIVVTAPGGRF